MLISHYNVLFRLGKHCGLLLFEKQKHQFRRWHTHWQRYGWCFLQYQWSCLGYDLRAEWAISLPEINVVYTPEVKIDIFDISSAAYKETFIRMYFKLKIHYYCKPFVFGNMFLHDVRIFIYCDMRSPANYPDFVYYSIYYLSYSLNY